MKSMTPADIERMAREAGLVVYADHLTEYDTNSAQQSVAARFAAAIRAQALDDAAQACIALAADHEESATLEGDARFAVYAKHQRRCAAAPPPSAP